jgi:hypothetical protein
LKKYRQNIFSKNDEGNPKKISIFKNDDAEGSETSYHKIPTAKLVYPHTRVTGKRNQPLTDHLKNFS